jgi:hypothetical protein
MGIDATQGELDQKRNLAEVAKWSVLSTSG